jgi:hypothetical protein
MSTRPTVRDFLNNVPSGFFLFTTLETCELVFIWTPGAKFPLWKFTDYDVIIH